MKKLPEKLAVAVSGGIDSLAAVINLGKKVDHLVHFHHGGSEAEKEYQFVVKWAEKYGYKLKVGFCDTNLPSNVSKEAWWREQRYSFFKEQPIPIVVGTTLDDAVEWYIFSALTSPDGGRLIEYSNENIIRPYLTTKKQILVESMVEKNVEWYEDPTNADENFCNRNFIRHVLLPQALKVNPGLYSMVKNKLLKRKENEHSTF